MFEKLLKIEVPIQNLNTYFVSRVINVTVYYNIMYIVNYTKHKLKSDLLQSLVKLLINFPYYKLADFLVPLFENRWPKLHLGTKTNYNMNNFGLHLRKT